MPNVNICGSDSNFDFTTIDLGEQSCTKKEGIVRWLFARRSWLDLDSMGIDATEDCNTSIVMKEKGFVEIIGFDSDNVTLNGTYSEDNGYYENTFSVDNQLFSKALRLLNCNQQNFCDWVHWISTSGCNQRLLGIENLNGTMGSSFKSTQSEHTYSLGGDADSQNSTTYSWKSYCEPMFTTVQYDSVPKL